MQRRQFLATLAAVPALSAKAAFGMDHISFITDEAAATPADAVVFARKYGLKWVELREVPGARKSYGRLDEAEAKAAAKELADSGLRVSFLNTPFFKTTLPGSEPVFRRPETPENREKRIARHTAEFQRRKEDFEIAFRNCHIYGVDKMRVFPFLRVAEPRKAFAQIADVLGEVTEWAAKEKIQILFENETSCNVVTCDEVADFLKLMPQKNFAFNWDPLNGADLQEQPFPLGYAKLPKKRILNVQVKGKSLLEAEQRLDWAGIFAALAKDGYSGCVGLETHYFDGTKIEKSHKSLEEIRRILET
ncbi:MAG: TIM barrel protein [Bryobacteraceae bacterium]|nr:TIM barrel protein [Bryobacteraceae bacterium]